jgi:hypothetical protein
MNYCCQNNFDNRLICKYYKAEKYLYITYMMINKIIAASIGMIWLAPTLAYGSPMVHSQAKSGTNNNNSNSNIPRNIVITKPSVKALPRLVTWQVSKNAQRGLAINDHVQLDIYKRAGSLVCTVELPAAATSYTITRKNCGEEYKVYSQYTATVTEVRTDNTSSDVATENFVTSPPRLTELLVRKRSVNADGLVNATLRWTTPAALIGVTEKYEYKITAYKNPATIIAQGSKTMTGNTIRVKNLPKKKLQYRVRVNSSEFGTSRWSKWKVFSLKKVS